VVLVEAPGAQHIRLASDAFAPAPAHEREEERVAASVQFAVAEVFQSRRFHRDRPASHGGPGAAAAACRRRDSATTDSVISRSRPEASGCPARRIVRASRTGRRDPRPSLNTRISAVLKQVGWPGIGSS
jgi:hypothetical protein